MDIYWLGGSAARLETEQGTVVLDSPGSTDAVIAAVSRPEAAGEAGEAFRIAGPGEYEIEGIFVVGMANPGDQDPPSVSYCVSAEGLNVCHLGSMRQLPDQAELERFGPVDVVLVAVGEGGLSPTDAGEVVGLLEPSLVVPLPLDGDVLSRFTKEMGADDVESEPFLRALSHRLPDEPRVHVLEQRSG